VNCRIFSSNKWKNKKEGRKRKLGKRKRKSCAKNNEFKENDRRLRMSLSKKRI